MSPPERTLVALLEEAARRGPERPALIYRDRTLGYGELAAMARRVAQGLSDLGVGPGDRVALWLPDLPPWLALSFACARLGAIAVAVNTRFRGAEVGDIVGRSGAKVLAFDPHFKGIDFTGILADVAPAALDRLECVIVCGAGAEPPSPVAGKRTVGYRELLARPPHEASHAAPGTGCNIFTTSGTTKAPKFVLHCQAGIADHARLVAADFDLEAPDAAVLQAIPLCGVFGYAQAMATLGAGRPLVMMPSFDAAEAGSLVQRYRITHVNGSDDMFRQMLAAQAAPAPFPSLRLCGYAAFNPALDSIVADAEARGVCLVGLYGMSEVQALYARQKVEAEVAVRKLPGGFPVAAAARARVRDPDSGRLLADGENGELELSGPSLMVGYYGNEAATRETLTDDGFVRTGDLGYVKPDGSFVFLTRMGDVLRLGGFLVSPAEIESVVQAHRAVDGCQVVGVTAAEGPRAVAFVTLEQGAEWCEEDVRAWCAHHMAKYKVPARILPLDEFPTTKSPNGMKIQRAKLREMASELTHAAAAGAARSTKI